MAAKMGRPPISNPKNIRITIRLDKNTKCHLDKYCGENKIEQAEAIREGIQRLPLKQK